MKLWTYCIFLSLLLNGFMFVNAAVDKYDVINLLIDLGVPVKRAVEIAEESENNLKEIYEILLEIPKPKKAASLTSLTPATPTTTTPRDEDNDDVNFFELIFDWFDC
ncbi:uncharacterized protein LOC119687168 [Teleopsis dalmanni]|uniref:uncharacterized protein LOC119687168 n=1 Tax=Teleopsis dalmanni TaxID=139649 RepID=UPI0018CE8389|nr:uncharacterized protein LOC119687168 [Teleopsis dalmanni]